MDRVERCEEKYAELFGGKPVRDEGSDPEFMRILQRFIFGEVCYTGSLDDRMRELITVTVLAVNQTLPQLKSHTLACLHVGCTPEEVRETVYQCAPFIGFPKTLNAIAAMNESFEKAGISLPLASGETVTEEDRYEKGLSLQSPVYGDEIAERYKWLPGEFAAAVPRFLTELGFGDFATNGEHRRGRRLRADARHALYGNTEILQRAELRKGPAGITAKQQRRRGASRRGRADMKESSEV